MILTPEIQQKIVDTINEDPTAPVVLPDHAYAKNGRVVVLVDGLPIDLHRHLHEVLIGPLGMHQRMHDASGVPGNVNPHLFTVVDGYKSPATHCPKGHKYEGNEMPPNSRGYRCRICYLASRPTPAGTSNAAKTHCPHGHEYTPENTKVDKTGRRRCLTCVRRRDAEYHRKARASRKETPK
ncbi:HNH endonuclease [Microbacterium phage Fizzles]|nr:HNH endonuclease [Microbacterium phage Fizzles]